jgi:alpha-N-arabinofuranosidase
VRSGEVYEVEVWARAHRRPVQVTLELCLTGRSTPAASKAAMTCEHAHWHRRTCRIASPGEGSAYFQCTLPGDSELVIDQFHLRPVDEGPVSKAVAEVFRHVPCPVLRFPGGCASCTYHWEHGIGPVHLRPVCDDPVFKYKMQYDFGTDEYLDLCIAQGIRPFITLNTTTGTPEEAAAWAAYVRGYYVARGCAVPAAYFMFGNENYGVWELGHMTGAMYVAQLREFVPAVRRAYPEARIVAIGEFESGGLRDAYKTPWRGEVLGKAAGLFDVLAVTRYAWGKDGDDLSAILVGVADNVAGKAADLEQQAQTIRDAGAACTMAVVEWNFWTRASHNDHAGFREPNDIRHCLYAAGLLNAFCRQGALLELACYYSLVNTMGMAQIHDGRMDLADVAKVFDLYRDALPGDVLALDVDAPMLSEQSKVVDANAVRTGDATYAFLVNFSATETVGARLEGLGSIASAQGLRAAEIVSPVAAFAPAFDGSVVTLPPMSLVRATLKPRGLRC